MTTFDQAFEKTHNARLEDFKRYSPTVRSALQEFIGKANQLPGDTFTPGEIKALIKTAMRGSIEDTLQAQMQYLQRIHATSAQKTAERIAYDSHKGAVPTDPAQLASYERYERDVLEYLVTPPEQREMDEDTRKIIDGYKRLGLLRKE